MKHKFCSNQPVKVDTSSNINLLPRRYSEFKRELCVLTIQWTQKNSAAPPNLSPRPLEVDNGSRLIKHYWTEKNCTMTRFIYRSTTFFFYHSCQPESLVLQLFHIPGLEAMWFNEEQFSLTVINLCLLILLLSYQSIRQHLTVNPRTLTFCFKYYITQFNFLAHHWLLNIF